MLNQNSKLKENKMILEIPISEIDYRVLEDRFPDPLTWAVERLHGQITSLGNQLIVRYQKQAMTDESISSTPADRDAILALVFGAEGYVSAAARHTERAGEEAAVAKVAAAAAKVTAEEADQRAKDAREVANLAAVESKGLEGKTGSSTPAKHKTAVKK